MAGFLPGACDQFGADGRVAACDWNLSKAVRCLGATQCRHGVGELGTLDRSVPQERGLRVKVGKVGFGIVILSGWVLI